MSYFQWESRYDIGVPEMNREHQKLIDLMNQLHKQHETHAGKDTIARTVDALFNFTKVHFAHEEAYMAKIKYPELKVHQLVHKDLLDKLTHHKTDFEKNGVLTDAFFSFLKRWLVAHIVGIDMKYSHHSHDTHA